jgi:hypothetical protein
VILPWLNCPKAGTAITMAIMAKKYFEWNFIKENI